MSRDKSLTQKKFTSKDFLDEDIDHVLDEINA